MSLSNRVLDTLKERRQRILDNNINCIPLPFSRFKKDLPGIEKETYYLISGATKSSKTQLTNYLFVYNTILYAYKHKNVITPKIFYYNLEETSEAITLRFMAFLLYTLDGIRISPTDLKSTDSDKPLSKDILDLLQSPKYKSILDFYEGVMTFSSTRNPTGIWKEVKFYAEENGTVHKEEYTYRDDFGETRKGQKFSYYIPNNPNEYIFIIIDHVSLIELERGLTLRECINKLSEYMIIFRNRYKYIPVVVQQQSTETNNLDAFKSNKIRPTTSGLSDSKYTSKDCDVMLGITNPHAFEIGEYLGYNIRTLKSNFRCLEVVLNRRGQSNSICPLLFDGAINWFSELPLPNQTEQLSEVYKFIDKLKESSVTRSIAMLCYNIKKFFIRVADNKIV